jgi:hypothetical protein
MLGLGGLGLFSIPMGQKVAAAPSQLSLFKEPEWYAFTCYVTKYLYEDFENAFKEFAKNFEKVDVGKFYFVTCLISDRVKANTGKDQFFKY